jgi:uncharacterized membrane protein
VKVQKQVAFPNLIVIVIFLQIVMYISLFLDFPIVRQVVGIAYLTVIPGVILIKLLKIKNLSQLEFVLFSVGFSVAFLMLGGLFINEFGPLIGLTLPLAVIPLSLFINTLILTGAAVAHIRQDSNRQQTRTNSLSFHPLLLILILIPILSIFGTYFLNKTGDNLFLLIMVVSIALLFVVGTFLKGFHKYYSLAIFVIALALVFHFSLVSNYIVPYGSDSPVELFVFQNTRISSHWRPTLPLTDGIDRPILSIEQLIGRYNAMPSVTILPTVYSNMLGIDATWVFKIIFPLIFAVVPVVLYLLWQPFIGKKFAFFAAFLFMAQSTFYTEMLALNRQMIAELFFVLLLFVLLSRKIKPQAKIFSFVIFSFGLIFSHYALAQIFLLLIFATWAISVWYLKKPSVNLHLSLIILFFVAMFGWYIYTSGAVVFDSFLEFGGYVSSQLGDFFNPYARGDTVLTGLGLTQSPSILNSISRGFAYLTQFFIVFGIIALIKKKTKFQFGREYMVFSMIAVVLLAALTIIPGFANTLNMTRFYHIILMVLAPFCIIGMWAFVKIVFKHEKKLPVLLLVIVILVPYFLFQTNFVYEVAKVDSWSIPLSKDRMDTLRLYGDFGYIDSYSVYGAEWYSTNVPYERNTVADSGLYTSLLAYGLVHRGHVRELSNETILNPNEFVYLSYISFTYGNITRNILFRMQNETSVIYSNGGSEVHWVPIE